MRVEFTADFGLWYDVDDEWIIQIMTDLIPDVDWGRFVFHKKLDHSAIQVIDADFLPGKIVGLIRPRGGAKQKLSSEIFSANVIPISLGAQYRAERLIREAERAKRCGEGSGPESS